MTARKIKSYSRKTEFLIEELTPYGEIDISRVVFVYHSQAKILKLSRITQEEINNLPNSREERETAELFEIPRVGTIVFINSFDTDYDSENYRKNAHETRGPYLLKKNQA